jgi:RNA polymerase sigma factor (sigma-70 family)
MSTGLAVPTRRPRPADTDGELTELARGGDQRAVAELYRRHVPAARSTARYLLHAQQDVDDVVSEAFAGVLAAFRTGHGPRGNFRCYLMACVRNACHVRRKPVTLLDEEHLAGQADVRHASLEDPEKFVEADTVARAFASLSPRWQQALWLSEVEQRPAGEVGEYMHIAPNATAALTHRARQAFASAYLSEHVAVAASIECTEFGVRLGAYVRNSLRATERRDVDVHLASCAN